MTLEDGLVRDIFTQSVKISTYLVAFAVLDFKYTEKVTSSGVKVKRSKSYDTDKGN